MSNQKSKWLLVLVVACCLAPATFADQRRNRDHRDQGCDPRSPRNCQQVPEGGSTAIYLLGAGLTCFGAMFLRS